MKTEKLTCSFSEAEAKLGIQHGSFMSFVKSKRIPVVDLTHPKSKGQKLVVRIGALEEFLRREEGFPESSIIGGENG
ncbi:MAG: hypothetical protein COW71_07890 [Ignavibacteriales bacterium CG18_big_fil_WC_8_21_14_2_50_31_20]|nr:MAG: hypothetical protein COW71_07890 [Ignavibacteriales bacterium CG18_big_fil_WC_8_21_14_2_50_31_20]